MASFSPVSKINGKPASPGEDLEERVVIPPDSATDNTLRGRVRKILEIVKSGRLCTVHGLAAEFNLSESHLQHMFKRQTGLRLGHFLVEQRLQLSAQLLLHGNMPIKQIASAVGYQHTSSFTRAFEHRFAKSPWAYRKHNKPITKILAKAVSANPS